jgi:SAM-dependent methyltransferase
LANLVARTRVWAQQARSVVRSRGLRGLAESIGRRVSRRRATSFHECAARVTGKSGLEIGGPSGVFRPGGILPIYPLVGNLDNCNFAATTIWESAPGRQLIADATSLTDVQDAHYDFLLASHVLEHVANPIKALREWRRVLQPGGLLVVIVPDQRYTFDHRRTVTTIGHLRDDFYRQTPEDDATHLDEVLALHDLSRDPEAGTRADFEQRCRQNMRYRAMHHHVFDRGLLTAVLSESAFQVVAAEMMSPYHIVALATRNDGT